MNNVQIKDNKYLQRELSSKAILSTNQEEVIRYNAQKSLIEKNRNISNEIDTLKEEMNQIKALLIELVGNKQ